MLLIARRYRIFAIVLSIDVNNQLLLEINGSSQQAKELREQTLLSVKTAQDACAALDTRVVVRVALSRIHVLSNQPCWQSYSNQVFKILVPDEQRVALLKSLLADLKNTEPAEIPPLEED